MAEKICRGENIKYSLVYVNEDDIQNLKNLEKKYHEIVGYGIVNRNGYSFYSVEDNYTNSILNHWTVDILNEYDNHLCWIILKTHPCNLYSIMTDLIKPSNYVCDINNFDVWKTKDKNCLVAVITDMDMN
jgi:hypothetical protein